MIIGDIKYFFLQNQSHYRFYRMNGIYIKTNKPGIVSDMIFTI